MSQDSENILIDFGVVLLNSAEVAGGIPILWPWLLGRLKGLNGRRLDHGRRVYCRG